MQPEQDSAELKFSRPLSHVSPRKPIKSHKAGKEKQDAEKAKAATKQPRMAPPSHQMSPKEYKEDQRQKKNIKNAALYLLSLAELSPAAAALRVAGGEYFESDAVVRAKRYAKKHELGEVFLPGSPEEEVLQGFGKVAIDMVAAQRPPEPELPQHQPPQLQMIK